MKLSIMKLVGTSALNIACFLKFQQSLQLIVTQCQRPSSLSCPFHMFLCFCKSINFNPIWTGPFANLKRLGGRGGKMQPPSSLAISSQMTMKLGKDTL